MDYEAEDKAALRKALLAMHRCPNVRCQRELRPALEPNGAYGTRTLKDHWACVTCDEVWHLPEDAK